MQLVPMRDKHGDLVAHAVVDDVDHEWAMSHRWHLARSEGRERPARSEKRNGRRRFVYLHVQVAQRAGLWVPGLFVDHRDGNSLNATRANLRPVTCSENALNQKNPRSGSKSHYRGVRVCNRHFQANVRIMGEFRYLGIYDEQTAGAVAMCYRMLFCPTSQEPGALVAEMSGLTGTSPAEMREFLRSVMSPLVYARQPWHESQVLRDWTST